VRHARHSVRAHVAVGPPRLDVGPLAPSSVRCDLFASPSGSDSAGDGSLSNPYASVVKLDQALAAGQTGCLRAGTYGSISTLHTLSANGTASARLTISSYPGETATISGWIDIEGSYTTVSHLMIDGSNNFYRTQRTGTNCPYPVSQGLVIAGHDNTLEYDDYYQSVASLRGNGIGIGWWGQPDNTTIRYTKIHDVGQCEAYDHLIYLAHGNNVQIYDNWLWNDPHGRGVQLYPAPTNARVHHNVIDATGVGIGFGNEAGSTLAGNQVYTNVIARSTGLPTENLGGVALNVYWGGAQGPGNTFTGNDAWSNPAGIGSGPGITMSGNITSDPQFTSAGGHDYSVASSSPVAGWGLWSGS
jgi:hypothetical protein